MGLMSLFAGNMLRRPHWWRNVGMLRTRWPSCRQLCTKTDNGEHSVTPTKPLAGIRVVDFSRVLAGPYCTMAMADMGAEVIKIERPGSGDDTRSWGPPFIEGESTYFMSVNRNKKSLSLDLKKPESHDVIKRLIKKSDVVVE